MESKPDVVGPPSPSGVKLVAVTMIQLVVFDLAGTTGVSRIYCSVRHVYQGQLAAHKR